MSYKANRTGGRCGCIAALPVMFAMLMLFIVTMVGDCHIDAGEAQCAAAERDAALILILTPLSGIAAFLLINWLVGRRK